MASGKIDNSTLQNAKVGTAVVAALKAAHTPKDLIEAGLKAFIDAFMSGSSLDESIGKALSGRAPDGGSWLLGRWTFFYKAFGIDINAEQKSSESVIGRAKQKGKEIAEGAKEVAKKVEEKLPTDEPKNTEEK